MKIILISLFSLSVLIFAYGCLTTIAYSSSIYLSEEDHDFISYFFGLVLCLMGFLFVIILSRLLQNRYDFLKTKYNVFNRICIVLLIISVSAPLYCLNLQNYNGVMERADYRYSQGKWDSAMKIYRLLSWRLQTPHKPIEDMQTLLKNVNYYNSSIDGIPHSNIIEQLEKFQKDNNLTVDGYLGNDTKALLYGMIYKRQLYLYSAKPTLHEITEAVKRFQINHALSGDGIVGIETLKELQTTK